MKEFFLKSSNDNINQKLYKKMFNYMNSCNINIDSNKIKPLLFINDVFSPYIYALGAKYYLALQLYNFQNL